MGLSKQAAGTTLDAEMNNLRHLDLFSGIGGFALAAQMAGGFETIGFCEIESFPQKVLKKNFPNIPIHDDVKTLDPSKYGTIDIITGGYPCQPFSSAGHRRGEDDDRHLWPEVFRIAKDARPRWLLCENVAGHVTMGLDQVLSDLESINYSAQAIIIPACAVNAPHRRNRVWIIANSNSIGQQRGIKGMCKTPRKRSSKENLFNCQLRELWSGDNIPSPRISRANDGISNRVDRIKSLGNAIVPQVAAEILRCIIEIERTQNDNT